MQKSGFHRSHDGSFYSPTHVDGLRIEKIGREWQVIAIGVRRAIVETFKTASAACEFARPSHAARTPDG